MDINDGVKILNGLKAIKKNCAKFDHCSLKCEFNLNNECILNQLGDSPSYWNLDDVKEKLKNAIELEEKTTDDESKKGIKNKGLSESNVRNLEAVQMFCEEHKNCDNCPLYKLGCIVRNMPKYWHLNWLKRYQDYDVKNASCKNFEYSHPPIYNWNYTHDVPNHRHEDSAQDMIHHPGHYNFRGIECKNFIEKFVSDPKSYYEGNIFKYLYRYLEKNKEEDLNKAMEYTRLLKEYLYGKKD